MRAVWTSCFLVLATLLLAACSSNIAAKKRTGFFKNYEGLKIVGEKLYFEQIEGADLSAYNKIYVPDIKVISNATEDSPRDIELYTQISAYTTAAYRKNILKNSSNYILVDVPQAKSVIMEIAISLVELKADDKSSLNALAFALNADTKSAFEQGRVRILTEARITDAMNGRLLARSMRVVLEKEISPESEHLRFSDLHEALDRWLNEAIAKR